MHAVCGLRSIIILLKCPLAKEPQPARDVSSAKSLDLCVWTMVAEQRSSERPQDFTPGPLVRPLSPLAISSPPRLTSNLSEGGCSICLLPSPSLWSAGKLSLSALQVPLAMWPNQTGVSVSLWAGSAVHPSLYKLFPPPPCTDSSLLLPVLTAPSLNPPVVFSGLIVLSGPCPPSCQVLLMSSS